jgi:hypothetical protein
MSKNTVEVREDADDNTAARCMLDNTGTPEQAHAHARSPVRATTPTHTHVPTHARVHAHTHNYVILLFRGIWLHERASVLRYTYIASLVGHFYITLGLKYHGNYSKLL